MAGLGAAAAAMPTCLRGQEAAAAKKPNFLLIVADDLATCELGCYGGKNVRTPNIDKLAREGLRFTHAFASTSMCVPVRASLYTGLYPVRNTVTRNHVAAKPGIKSVVHYLQPLGYRVGLTGKVHAQPQSVFPFEKVPGFEPNCTAATAAGELDGIRAFMSRDASQPFCLMVCSVLPHAPWTVGDESHFPADKLVLPPHWIDTPETRRAFAKYCAEVEVLDRQVGDVVKTVDELGPASDTLVLFCGEQGPQFPGGKWTLYDHGLRTALIARLPGRIRPGTATEAIVQYEDVTPTLVDLAGGQPPEGLDGRSFLAVLTGAKAEHRRYAFGVHNNWPEGAPYPIRSIRSATHKLILNLTPEREYVEKHMMQIDREDYWHSWVRAAASDARAAALMQRFVRRPPVELYDVRNDPWEMENLAGRPELADLQRDLEQRLREWMREQQDPGAALDIEEKPPEKPPAAKPAKAAKKST